MQKLGAAGGGSPLLDVFFDQRHRLISLATRITGCRSHAEDIVHDAYLKLDVSSLSSTIRSQASYLTRVVRNLSIDHYRRRSLEQRLMCEEEESAEATVSATGTPEEQVSDQQQLERIAGALAELPERTRYVFEMCRIHGMKQKDIAESLGVSPTLVNFMIQEALLHCRKTLRD
ncbi:putative RNA polymerase sigma factor FecI [compost metagenome]|uniref:RNA polymerase sigma-70 factor, ECF subfamily n=1 Tax=Pseudomonas jinjuensis TaxID=198616 RepID=A0A1H0HYE3_9PSED|nr:RNA polymerase factor sigma-70 [Pseudomonas jinjuensis]SDO23870.1 RNA polymerase sigma-70 factor, ECF subfamily [Pseudomonas jinjuensis]